MRKGALTAQGSSCSSATVGRGRFTEDEELDEAKQDQGEDQLAEEEALGERGRGAAGRLPAGWSCGRRVSAALWLSMVILAPDAACFAFDMSIYHPTSVVSVLLYFGSRFRREPEAAPAETAKNDALGESGQTPPMPSFGDEMEKAREVAALWGGLLKTYMLT